ncbi:MAG: HEAT repeat domain-containing protein [Eubacteriaceae bacterium]|nr:HEAT repeat domain-containing protein [Eubacteriaceae bacterium]
MNESELYRELVILTDERDRWEESVPFVSSLLLNGSVKIQAKALWLLGETGLVHPMSVKEVLPSVASFLEREEPLLRERALNALGRTGRGSFAVIEPWWVSLFRFASDEEPKVRLAFIWASENIATNTPDVYGDHMHVFETLLGDADDRVRMEAPEIFRVLGARRPAFVMPYLDKLRHMSTSDENPVVRVHCLGAIRTMAEKGM